MDVYERVLDLLRPLGITEKYIGAKQLIQAIEIVLKCPGSLHAIQKEIYDVIALQYSVSGGAVERNLRMVSQKAWETDSQYMENLAGYPSTEYGRHIERVIQHLAVFYRTSKQCARKRMLELGYDSVRGVLDYVNGEYMPAYFSTPGVMDWNQTFTISVKDAVAEYGRNGRFRELVSSGCYVYVEGKFCINKPACVRRKASGKLYLTKAAREAVDRCCLLFEYSSEHSDPRYADGRLNREPQVTEVRGQKFVIPQNAAEPGLCSPEDFIREAAWITSVRTQIGGMDFGDALAFLMKERKMTSERLEEASQISVRTISRLRNDREYAVSYSQIVALSVGLHLPPAISSELMEKAGLRLRNTTTHNAYGMILCAFFMADILTVNAYLIAMGMEPLTQMGKVS